MIRWVYLFIFFAFLFSCDTASNVAQPNKSYFIKYFGADGNQTARDLIVNSDGTFFILGNSIASDGATQKVYIAKANAFGELIWQKTYGTTVGMDARDFLITRDNQYLVVVANRGSDALLSRYSASEGVKNGNDSILISNTFANSVVELTDGSYIVEGYLKASNGQSLEQHFRWTGDWGPYLAPSGVWIPTYIDPKLPTANYLGVSTVQLSPTSFYTFGNTDADYTSGNHNLKFYAYTLGPEGQVGNGAADNGIFDNEGYESSKTLTSALGTVSGGYLLVGISTTTLDNLKVVITSSDNKVAFTSDWVLHDVLLKDIERQTISLGISLGKGTPFATACSSASYNFILANTYNTPTGNSDILLMKIGNTLEGMWGNQATGEQNYVVFGGDGDDTAAAVAELPDGHIMVLGTMQLGNPPAQFKIALMKLNANGKLEE